MIAQGSTPTLMLAIDRYDLTGASSVVVSIKTQNKRVDVGLDGLERISISGNCNGSMVAVHLTQEESLSLDPCIAYIQVRWVKDGESYTTESKRIDIVEALYKGVI